MPALPKPSEPTPSGVGTPSVTVIDESVARRRARCSVCKSPHKNEIHALRASGMKLSEIEAALKAMGPGRGLRRETMGLHFRVCLGGKVPVLDEALATSISSPATSSDQGEADFAILVRKRATELLAAGALRVTASHGLAAQALLDRRAEHQADRDLALNMARLLSGAISLPPMEVIEGRAVAVVPPDATTLLAPPEIIEPR